MVGDERVRYCPDCKLDVYNFSSMSDEDVERIVPRREQRLCARVRQRPDGTVMTRNSSVSFSAVMQRISRAASIALAAAISVAPAMAGPPRTPGHNLFQIQQTPGGLALAVVDRNGAVIPKARITIVNEKTKTKVSGETDANGQFRISDLPDGSYEITIEILGFKTLKQSHVDVPGSAVPLKLQLELQVDFVGEVVTVNHPNGFRKFISKLRHIF
jgi:Carboxypeptidase regulatory-like domain